MKKLIQSSNAPKAVGPYSQAVEINGTLYVSGQIPIDPATGQLVQGSIAEQTEQVFRNIATILTEAGYTFADVMKTTVLLKDMGDFAAMNEVYGRHYPAQQPARSAFQVAKLPLDAMVEIETIAMKS
ncbi:MAG: RidA family protein [Prevotellaceae bacterium]|jgi:2-iminobutanoate/2-iminopropanoate deaminase|nr:RidA family protein [Prevotellaceae bacterium]